MIDTVDHTDQPQHPTNFDLEAHAMCAQLRAKGLVMAVYDAAGRGSGISVMVNTQKELEAVPRVLRDIAAKLERDIAFGKAQGKG